MPPRKASAVASAKDTPPSKTKASANGAPAKRASKASADGAKITFEFLAPEAGSVQLAGSFDGWDARKPLTKGRNGKWTVALELTPGRYEYRYVVDGSWQNDPKSPESVPNPFGSLNSVITV